jgi:hypothetical protein
LQVNPADAVNALADLQLWAQQTTETIGMVKHPDRARPEILEPDYEDPKEVYAFFGLAAYWAQLLEQGIANLLVGLRIQGKKVPTWVDVRNLYEKADRNTLGHLLRAVGELAPLDPALEDRLHQALKKRNYLMHHFFVEHAESLLSAEGKRRMIDELRDVIIFFKVIDPQVDELWLAIWRKYGFTEERIERELEIVKRALQMKDDST